MDRILTGLSINALLKMYTQTLQKNDKLKAEMLQLRESSATEEQLTVSTAHEKELLRDIDSYQTQAYKFQTDIQNIMRVNKDLQFKLKKQNSQKDARILYFKLASERSEEKMKLVQAKHAELVKAVSAAKRKNKEL